MKPYISKIKFYIFLQVGFAFLCTILSSVVPILQKWLFDVGIHSSSSDVLIIVVVYIAIQLLNVMFTYFCLIFTWKGAIKFELLLKRSFLRSVFRLRYQKFYEKPIGEYISLQGNDITALEQDFLQPSVDIIRSINMILIYGVVMFIWVDWRISLTILITSLITIIGPKITGKYISNKRVSYQLQMAAYVSKISDLLEGFKLINTFTRKNLNMVHEDTLQETADKRYEFGKAKSISLSVNDLAVRIVQIAAFTAAGLLLVSGHITVGTAVATFGYVESFLSPIDSILYDVNAIQSVKEVKKRFLDYITDDTVTSLKTPNALQNKICLEKVCFSFDNFSIKNLTFNFDKGKKYAVIGHSGSGKSTILKMLMGYLQPSSGTISIDNNDLAKIDTSALISYIDQNEHIYRDGYLENASVYGSYPKEKAYTIINVFSKGLHDIVRAIGNAANCQDLSGGEKQVLSFLRLATKDASVILLDESFSALDINSRDYLESYLFIDKNMADKTIIYVTHDLRENLNRYDEVLLMKDGAIIAHDRFDTLRQTDEYKNVFEAR